MINPNDVAKAMRLIAEEIESKGYDVIINESLSCHIDGVVIADVTIKDVLYKVDLQFKTDLLKKNLTYDNMKNTMSVTEFYSSVLNGIKEDRN